MTSLTLDEARQILAGGGTVPDARLEGLSAEARARLEGECTAWVAEDVRRNQIEYYRPVNDAALAVHRSCAREVGIQGGRRAGKTGLMLAEAVIQATGLVPETLRASYPASKLHGREHPIAVRLVVTSLVTAWDLNLKPKLQWFAWNGRLNGDALPGDPALGHWGWIPQRWLPHGDWDEAWSERHRTLTLWHPERRESWSTVAVMSQDQSLAEFSQGAYDLILEDELPSEAIHRANQIRAIERCGQLYVGGTPPDDRSSAVTAAWFFDQVVAPGLEGANPAETFAVVLPTDENRTLDAAEVARVAKGLTLDQRRAVLRGEGLHLAGRIIRGFTDRPKTWCFRCVAAVRVAAGACGTCGGRELARYAHVWDEEDLAWPGPPDWPCVFYMDPHQARPTACAWYKVDPQDAWWQIGEAEIAGDALAVKRAVEAFEREHEVTVVWRKADPKITVQRNQFARAFEGDVFTIRRAFEEIGFPFDDANTNFTVAVERIERALRPDPYTRAPRLRVHRSCARTVYHLTHNVWDASRRVENRDTKETPGRQHSDFVAVTRYLAMDAPEFRALQMVAHQQRVSLVAPSAPGRSRATGW